MNVSERLFLAAVFLVGGGVCVVALGALGVVRVPYVSFEEDSAVTETTDLLPGLAPPPPEADRGEESLLAELAALDTPTVTIPSDGLEGEADAIAAEDAQAGDGSDGESARGGPEGDPRPGKGKRLRDPLVDHLKAQVDLSDPGQVMGFLIAMLEPGGTKLGEEDFEFLFAAIEAQKDFGACSLLLTHLERIGGEEVTAGVLEFISSEGRKPALVVRAMETLRRQGDDAAVEGLVEVLAETKHRKLRDVAFRSLLGAGNAAATEPLLRLLEETPDPALKRYALAAVSQLGGAAGAEAVLSYARSRDPFERQIGMRSLNDLKSPAAVPVLGDALSRESNPQVRQQVVRAIGRIRDPRGIQPVGRIALYGESRMLRFEAIRALATIGRMQAIPTLQSIVDTDENKGLRRGAERAIQAIDKQVRVRQERARRKAQRPRGRR